MEKQPHAGGEYTAVPGGKHGYPTEVGALFTTVSSIRVSRVSVMVSDRDSVK